MPVATATACISLAILLYVLQVNQVSVLEFNLSQAQARHSQLMDTNTQLRVQAAQLTAVQRIQSIATQRLHMVRTDLSRAVWINVVVPPTTPSMQRRVPVDTGPLAWMHDVARVLWASL